MEIIFCRNMSSFPKNVKGSKYLVCPGQPKPPVLLRDLLNDLTWFSFFQLHTAPESIGPPGAALLIVYSYFPIVNS